MSRYGGRVANSKARVRARVGPGLYSVMEPGDEIVAGAWARTGPPLGVDMALPFVGWLAFLLTRSWDYGLAGHGHLAAANALTTGLFVLSVALSALPFLRKQVFVAVTRRQLICYRLKYFAGRDRLMFAVPLPAGTVTRKGWSMAYTGPDGKPIRFNAGPRGRRDLREVTAALQTSGTITDPAQPRALL